MKTKNREAEYKGRIKNYTDKHPKTTHLDIGIGELFLKSEQRSKTQIPCAPDPVKVVDCNGLWVMLETIVAKTFNGNVSEI